MSICLIKNARIVNEGKIFSGDVLIENNTIVKIGTKLIYSENIHTINANGKYLLPGIIDAQVHFREPGLTHKGDINSESKAAIAGGITSFIDMPNTLPNVLSIEQLEEKYQIADKKSPANFGFLLGVNADNINDILKTDSSELIGITDDGLYFTKKGNLLSDNPDIMEKLFAGCKTLIAIHSEKEQIIEANEKEMREKYGENIPIEMHPVIRSEKACYEATEQAIKLANKYNARVHILHLSTLAETRLFRNDIPLTKKNITTEVSVHHLWFSNKDYQRLGTLIKWNPAIKTEADRKGLLQALIDDKIDIITTDHAPHAWDEKLKPYFQSMSGAPMVQHSLNCMLEFYKQELITLPKIVEKMCHNPALLYRIENRGFIREGYFADFVLVDDNAKWTVDKTNILYKCGWSPLEGQIFNTAVTHTFVNGNLVYENGKFNDLTPGQRLTIKHN